MPKSLLLFTWVLLLAALSYAGTMSEESLKGYDPYLADKEGFDSLFINPAGMANQTEIFNITMEMGTWGKAENYALLDENLDSLEAVMNGEFSEEDAEKLFPRLANELDEPTLQEVFAKTTYKNLSPAEIQNTETWKTDLSNDDKKQIQENLSADVLQQQIMDQFDSIQYNLEFETRWGTLIRGFGLGVYGNVYALYSLGAQGIEDLVYENGIIAGYGFELGRFKLGFSGRFALLVADDPSIPFRIRQSVNNQQILYGYAWGLDAGLIWEPVESLRFGLVINDFVGSITRESVMSKGTVQDILDGTIDSPSGGYSFALDMSVGVSWQPQWRVIQPKLSMDFYDVIGLIRSDQRGYSGLEDFYATAVPVFLRHIRAGVNLRFWGFLDIGLNYYMEYITLGVGLDIAFFEIFAEFRMKQDFEDIGVNGMFRLKF